MVPEVFDSHTADALLAVADDLSLAAHRALERVAALPNTDAVDKALKIYDVLNDAIVRIVQMD